MTAGARSLVMSGHGWRDELVLAPFGESRGWTSGALSADARRVVVRTGEDCAERLLVVGARCMALPGVEMNFATPTTAEYSRRAARRWMCDFPAGPSSR